MIVVTCTIPGPIPSKKNSKRRIMRGKNIFMVPSERHEAWHGLAFAKVNNTPKIGTATRVQINFWMKDNRRTDLTNQAESIMDLLVDVGIIDDDCWQKTGPVLLNPCGIDKEFPRAVVTLTKE